MALAVWFVSPACGRGELFYGARGVVRRCFEEICPLPPLGAHMSIAGGYYKAVEAAARVGCDCVQIFTGNPRSFQGAKTKPPPGRSSAKNKNR